MFTSRNQTVMLQDAVAALLDFFLGRRQANRRSQQDQKNRGNTKPIDSFHNCSTVLLESCLYTLIRHRTLAIFSSPARDIFSLPRRTDGQRYARPVVRTLVPRLCLKATRGWCSGAPSLGDSPRQRGT